MRSRLTVLAAVIVVATTTWLSPSAGAQVPPTHGELIPGGASASANDFDQSNGQAPVAPRGRNTNRTCWYEARLGDANYTRVGLAELRQRLADQQTAGGGDQLQVRYVCEDSDSGANRTVVPTTWPRNGTAFVVPPEVLAQQAREAMWFPPPRGATAPSLADGVVTQLPAYFTVGNWAPLSVRATAGTVWAEVNATPVTQTWAIADNFRGETYAVQCDGPGVAFDPASGLTPPPDACVWDKPPHSSAGQTTRSNVAGTAQGEACFPATVTITWQVAWTSSTGAGDSFPDQFSAASTCIVVKEIQAVVSGDPGG